MSIECDCGGTPYTGHDEDCPSKRRTPAEAAPASTGRELIGYVSANTMQDLLRGNSVMAAILTRNDVAGVDCALYAAPVSARELDVEAERREFEMQMANLGHTVTRYYDHRYADATLLRWDGWLAARSAAQATQPESAQVSTEQAGDAREQVRDAARYRWLRGSEVEDVCSGPLSVGRWIEADEKNPRWEAVDWLYSDALDRAIDEEMKKENG